MKKKPEITTEALPEHLNAPDYDYAEYAEKPQIEDLQALADLAARQSFLETRVIEAEEALRVARENFKQVAEKELPEVMDRLKLEKFTTTDGIDIEITEKIRASLSKKNQKAGFRWLTDNGHGAIIKREVKLPFGLGEHDAADRLVEFLADAEKRKEDFGVVLSVIDASSVHAGTLSSLVKGLLEDGEDVPLDTLGVFRQRIAKVK